MSTSSSSFQPASSLPAAKQQTNQQNVSSDAINAANNAANSAAEILAALPRWLQPGVSPATHIILRVVLFLLNALLASFAAMRVLSPHFEIMLLLCLALTASYFVFMAEINKLHAQAQSYTRQQQSASVTSEEKKQN
ncbi:unnamed protein product [Agarophyton chilense]